MQSRLRITMLGLLAVMLAGSIMAATASAEAGPFWRHRPTAEGEGSKIEANAPESFKGTGSEQKLKSTIASTAVTINSPSTTVKGNIFNNERQGQIELENVYNQPTLAEPTLKGCLVTVGSRNIVQIKGHLMWKWNGTAEQLTEQPQANQKWDIGFTAVEPRKQGTGTQILSSGTFTTVTLSPAAACGVLAGTFNVTGSEIGIPAPSGLKEWSKTLTVRTLDHKQGTGRLLQHYWDTEFIGAELGLALGPNKATLVGQTTAETSNEVSVFEKS